MEFSIESTLNKNMDEFPIGLYCPESGAKVYWLCDKDADGKIIGTFKSEIEGDTGKQSTFYGSREEAFFVRDTLLNAGWKPLKRPEVTVYDPNTGKDRAMSRKEKRRFQRMYTHEAKKYAKREGL